MPGTAATERLRNQYSFDGPASRWKRAQEVSGSRTSRHGSPDPLVSDAAEYLRRCASGHEGRSEAARRFPLIAGAEALEQDTARVRILKILVLGNSPQVEIADRFELSVALLDAWEHLFFDVRGNQDATSWVQQWVVGPAEKGEDPGWAVKLKTAWCGGPLVAQAIVDAECRVPISEGQRLFDRTLKFHLRFDEAMNVTFETDDDRRWFLDAGLELKVEEKRLKFATEKLQIRCQEALWKHERFLQRLKAVEAREQRRSERRARQSVKPRTRRRKKELGQEEQRFEQAQRDLDQQRLAQVRAAAAPLYELRWHSSATSAASAPKPIADGSPAAEEMIAFHPLQVCESLQETRLSPSTESQAA